MSTSENDRPEVVLVAPPAPDDAPSFTGLLDLASELIGGKAIAVSDDFFAGVDNMLRASTPVFVEDRFTDHGKWMDGWESRRRRTPGHDWAIVRLGARGLLAGFDVDTSFFTGNMPESCQLYGIDASGAERGELTATDAPWFELSARTTLAGGAHNFLEVLSDATQRPVTHVRLDIFPDGGVARLHAYGAVHRDFTVEQSTGQRIDLACATSGGCCISSSDDYFSHRSNLILPGRPRTMGEGWETKRRRGPGHDWIVVRLGCPGEIDSLIIDTAHFKGNYPDSCELHGCTVDDDDHLPDPTSAEGWTPVLASTRLSPNSDHRYDRTTIIAHGPFSHVRLRIHPDGGVARLRVIGTPCPT